jgi:hypothetical protein
MDTLTPKLHVDVPQKKIVNFFKMAVMIKQQGVRH